VDVHLASIKDFLEGTALGKFQRGEAVSDQLAMQGACGCGIAPQVRH